MTRIGFVRRTILSRVGESRWAPAWALAAILAPTLLRSAMASFVSGVPFLTYFPTLLVVATVMGWRWGAAVLVASAVAANYFFQPPVMAFAFGPQEMVATTFFVLFGALIVSAAEALRRSVIELEEARRRETELNLELQHRVNNNMTVIQSLARQMARQAHTPEAFYTAFSERLLAISEANQVLSRRGWEIAALPELAEVALKPFEGRSIELLGAPCKLPIAACVPLVLALHELGTNAVKYGALSVPGGCVRIRWTLDNGRCRIAWKEEGGPVVGPPTRQGLGTRLLRGQNGLESVTVDYRPTGVVCDIVVAGATPLHEASPRGRRREERGAPWAQAMDAP